MNPRTLRPGQIVYDASLRFGRVCGDISRVRWVEFVPGTDLAWVVIERRDGQRESLVSDRIHAREGDAVRALTAEYARCEVVPMLKGVSR